MDFFFVQFENLYDTIGSFNIENIAEGIGGVGLQEIKILGS